MQTDFSGYFCLALSTVSVTAQDVTITIHLRGVYESKISLLPLTGVNALKPITEVQGVKNGETTTFQVPEDNLPGEFVLFSILQGRYLRV